MKTSMVERNDGSKAIIDDGEARLQVMDGQSTSQGSSTVVQGLTKSRSNCSSGTWKQTSTSTNSVYPVQEEPLALPHLVCPSSNTYADFHPNSQESLTTTTFPLNVLKTQEFCTVETNLTTTISKPSSPQTPSLSTISSVVPLQSHKKRCISNEQEGTQVALDFSHLNDLTSTTNSSDHHHFSDNYQSCNSFSSGILSPTCKDVTTFFNNSSPYPQIFDEPIIHDWIWLKRPNSDSRFQYKVLDIQGTPGYLIKVVIAIPVMNDVICGTNNILFSELLKNKPKNDPNAGLDLSTCKIAVFQSLYDDQVFERSSGSDDTFDVSVTNRRKNNSKPIVMKNVSKEGWNKLTQVISSSKFFYSVISMFYSDVSGEDIPLETFSSPIMKKLLISYDMESITRAVSQGVESLEAFRSLPLEDQIISLQEAIIEAAFLFATHSFDKSDKSFVLSCLHLENHIQVMLHESMLKMNPVSRILDETYSQLLSAFYDIFREDAFVINVLCILSIFRERTGVSSSQIIRHERQAYFDLLEKYFIAKIDAGEWNTNLNDCWQHIFNRISDVSNVKFHFETFWTAQAKVQQQEQYRQSAISHDFICIKKSPMSQVEYRLLDIQGIAFVSYSAILEVRVESDGLISGTKCSFHDLMKHDDAQVEVHHISSSHDSPSFLVMTSVDGQHKRVFKKRYQVLSDSNSFQVDITSSLSRNVITMEDMNIILWQRLNQTIEASVILRDTMCCRHFTTSSSSDEKWKRLEVRLTWETMAKQINKACVFFELLSSLTYEEQTIIKKESIIEIAIIQEAPFYDKETTNGVLPAVNNNIFVCLQPGMFMKFPEGKLIVDSLQGILNDWDDYLRKDDLITTLLSLICLFKERSGLSVGTRVRIQEERNIFLDLLDKYILSKVKSRDWIASHQAVWSRIHLKLNQISSIKHLLENVVLKIT